MSARFLSTPSRRGRHHRQSADLQFEVFLSTPSRRGRPYPGLVLHRTYGVSIHALAKRATGDVYQLIGAMPVSIHALAKRATSHRSRKRLMAAFLSTPSRRGRLTHLAETPQQRNQFLSTPSRRGRPDQPLKTPSWSRIVSIHALAKRATAEWTSITVDMAFLSTPSRRGRRWQDGTSGSAAMFLSTPSRRGRHQHR